MSSLDTMDGNSIIDSTWHWAVFWTLLNFSFSWSDVPHRKINQTQRKLKISSKCILTKKSTINAGKNQITY